MESVSWSLDAEDIMTRSLAFDADATGT